jgi:hypothetical protein
MPVAGRTALRAHAAGVREASGEPRAGRGTAVQRHGPMEKPRWCRARASYNEGAPTRVCAGSYVAADVQFRYNDRLLLCWYTPKRLCGLLMKCFELVQDPLSGAIDDVVEFCTSDKTY